MATTRREQIMAAIRTALAGTTGVGTRIYRSRVEPLARAESPAIVVEPVNDQAQPRTTLPFIDWHLTVRVVVVVRGAIPDQLADPAVADIHSKLTNDPSLGGLAIDIQPLSVAFETIEADQPCGVVMCDYRVMYRTSVKDLTRT